MCRPRTRERVPSGLPRFSHPVKTTRSEASITAQRHTGPCPIRRLHPPRPITFFLILERVNVTQQAFETVLVTSKDILQVQASLNDRVDDHGP